mmetsp:Transcript_6267/g.23558  ORF Transcript_6267/g.23558 Transcript_6267/m.23558 type:complete len:167 (-) Transcript_6267:1024-1524(-)
MSLQPILIASDVLQELTVVQISCGGAHNLNLWGQLGDFVEHHPVVRVLDALQGKMATHVAAGVGHSLVCTTDGEVFSFGWNMYGQLGVGEKYGEKYALPEAVNVSSILSGEKVIQISAGDYQQQRCLLARVWVYSSHLRIRRVALKLRFCPLGQFRINFFFVVVLR